MSTTSTVFSLTIATTSDTVNVVTQIANNFTTLDSILSQAHTGTGQLKQGVVLNSPSITSPTLVGTMTGGTIIATTGSFQTITATGGTLTASTFAIGTYSLPATIGAANEILTVVTANAVWVANAPGTGANTALGNLGTVAINTSLNTFTGGFVTVARVIATSGALTGLTSFQATTGTFAGNLVVSATATINVVNCTGGAITAGGFAIGTYAYPATVGSTGQLLSVTTANAVWVSNTSLSIMATYIAGQVNVGTDFQATNHGLLVVYWSGSAGQIANFKLQVLSSAIAAPTTVIGGLGYGTNPGGAAITGTWSGTVTIGIKKDHYWRVDTAGGASPPAPTINFMPLS